MAQVTDPPAIANYSPDYTTYTWAFPQCKTNQTTRKATGTSYCLQVQESVY